jgi:hypothetical protein
LTWWWCLGQVQATKRLERAVAAVIAEGKSVTYDLKRERDDPTAVTTMCGHHQISPALVRYLRKLVRADKMEPEAAARRLATFCPCGIFNHRRAARLLTE